MDRRSQQVYKTFDKLGIHGPRPNLLLGNAGQLRKGVSFVVVVVVVVGVVVGVVLVACLKLLFA